MAPLRPAGFHAPSHLLAACSMQCLAVEGIEDNLGCEPTNVLVCSLKHLIELNMDDQGLTRFLEVCVVFVERYL